MSATDIQGPPVAFNQAFVQVSGYARDQLRGASHNLVRHPDIRSEVFADLWRTQGDGETWTGMIKNRRGNSDRAVTAGPAEDPLVITEAMKSACQPVGSVRRD